MIMTLPGNNFEETSVIFDTQTHTIELRPDLCSSVKGMFRITRHEGPLAPCASAVGGRARKATFTITYDKSPLGKYADDRFGLATRVLPDAQIKYR